MDLKKILIFFIIGNVNFTYGDQPIDDYTICKLIDFLNEFIQYKNTSFKLVFSTCWNTENMMRVYEEIPALITFNGFKSLPTLNQDHPNHILFIVDTSCNNSENQMKTIPTKYFHHPFQWIIFDNNQFNFNQIEALVDSNILVVTPNNDNMFDKDFILHQIYQIEKFSSLIYEFVGSWSSKNGLQVFINPISARHRNLKGKLITFSLVLLDKSSVSHLDDYVDIHIDTLSKLNYILMKCLTEAVNGSMNYRLVDTWGYKDPKTGIWSGLIGDLVEKRSLISGTPLFITAERIEIIEYLSMTTPTRGEFIFREPPLSSVSNIYLLPFSGAVWKCSCLLVLIFVVTIFLIFKFQEKYTNDKDARKKIKNSKLSDFILLGIGTVCQMGSDIQLKIASARIFSIFILIAILFLYTSYTANIVALLQSTDKTIQTLSDLLESNLVLGVDDTPYSRHFFKHTTEPVRKELYRRKISSSKGGFMNLTTGIDRVRTEMFAFHAELGTGYKVIEATFQEHEKCQLTGIEYYEFGPPWAAMEKNSPYKEMLKVNLFKIREYGIQLRLFNKIYTKKSKCTSNSQNWSSVSLRDCYGAFAILLVGCGMAVALFVMENITKREKK